MKSAKAILYDVCNTCGLWTVLKLFNMLSDMEQAVTSFTRYHSETEIRPVATLTANTKNGTSSFSGTKCSIKFSKKTSRKMEKQNL